jgi:hypothetical protein
MLFLAVFCGFLAENIRENKLERHREKEYVRSLVKDLEYDTTQFKETIRRISDKIPYYDSVFQFFLQPEAYDNKLPFKFYMKTNDEIFYSPVEPTIQQLKNSGNLRLIENKLVLDSILIYESHINGSFLNQTNYVVEFNKRMLQLPEKTFDYTSFNQFLSDWFADKINDDPSVYPLILRPERKENLKEMYDIYAGTKASEIFYIRTLMRMIQEAANLIRFIKKEYHLK